MNCEIKHLLYLWQIHQHCEDFEEVEKDEKELLKYGIDMKKDYNKYLEKFGLVL